MVNTLGHYYAYASVTWAVIDSGNDLSSRGRLNIQMYGDPHVKDGLATIFSLIWESHTWKDGLYILRSAEQAITWSSNNIQPIGTIETTVFPLQIFFQEIHLNMSSAKWCILYSGFNVLKQSTFPPIYIHRLLHQKQVSRPWIRNYIPQFHVVTFTYVWPRYPLLATKA